MHIELKKYAEINITINSLCHGDGSGQCETCLYVRACVCSRVCSRVSACFSVCVLVCVCRGSGNGVSIYTIKNKENIDIWMTDLKYQSRRRERWLKTRNYSWLLCFLFFFLVLLLLLSLVLLFPFYECRYGELARFKKKYIFMNISTILKWRKVNVNTAIRKGKGRVAQQCQAKFWKRIKCNI